MGHRTPVIALLDQGLGRHRMVMAVRELHSRGAPVLALVEGEGAEVAPYARQVLSLPSLGLSLSPLGHALLLQLLASEVARLRGAPSTAPATWPRA